MSPLAHPGMALLGVQEAQELEQRALLLRAEDAGLNATAPPQQRWVDGWLVRFSPGRAKRARCIQPVAPGYLPVAERLARCAQVLAEAGLPLVVRITPFSQPEGLDALLAEHGLRHVDDTEVWVLPHLDAISPPALPAGFAIHAQPPMALAHRLGQWRGSPPEQSRAHAERLLASPVPYSAFELRLGDEIVACAQTAREADLVGLYDVYTHPSARGRGCARWLCEHALWQARERGAQQAYLQVESDNLAALAVYRRLGFRPGYRYHYRVA
jgi:GNAT superfamily N-acetyltransferase